MKNVLNIILLIVVGLIIISIITVSIMDINKAPMIILMLVIGLAAAVLIKNRMSKME